jgi:voltage-gated potassium channel
MTATTLPSHSRSVSFHWQISEFWSGDLGLTLMTISLVLLLFVVTPLRTAGLPGRFILDIAMMLLMVYGAAKVERSLALKVLLVGLVLLDAVVLGTARVNPSPSLNLFGSILATVTLALYARIVLVVMFRGGPVRWSRIQGGVCAYMLLGMMWASAYQVLEQLRPGAFKFVTAPATFDELTSKLTYYSFCTLTTVGSDVAPLYPFARSLTTAEAMTGQLFPAILIGALVAMSVQSRAKS